MSSAHPPVATNVHADHKGTGQNSALRDERDRFLALAFCSADLLFELAPDRRVLFAGGATGALLGYAPKKLIGKDFLALVAPQDRVRIEHLLHRASAGSRFDRVRLHLNGRDRTPAMALSGYSLPDLGGRIYASLRMSVAALTAEHRGPLRREPEGAMMDQDSFAEVAGEAVHAAAEIGEGVGLALLEFDNLNALRRRMDGESGRQLQAMIGARICAASLGGDTAGRLDDEHYALLHTLDLDLGDLAKELANCARSFDPVGAGVSVGIEEVSVDTGALGRDETTRAVLYTINTYCNKVGDFSISNLSQGLRALTEETVERIVCFRRLIRDGDFTVRYQPICDLMTGASHHFEALARFDTKKVTGHVFELITFAEDVGLICEFDFAMCKKVLKAMRVSASKKQGYAVAVNLSAHSLGAPSFMSNLLRLLKTHKDVRDRLLFEVTESAKIQDLMHVNSAIQSLREAGHAVCLDDFGTGEAAFRYLAALDVDMAKIDGVYVRAATRSAKGKALLKAMAATCRELGVSTVAEMVETKTEANIVRECGIDFGQGYLFGRPSETVEFDHAPANGDSI